MVDNQGILHACSIDGDGYGQVLTGADISKAIKDDALAWVHLDGNDEGSRQWLKRELTYIDDIIINALLEEETRPRILEFESGALMILRGVNLNENAEPEDMISVRLWLDEHRIVSVQRRQLKAVEDIYDCLIEGKGPKNSGDFIALLAAKLFERMGPVFSSLDENLDNIEEEVMDNPDISKRHAINEIRKQAIVFRRYITPQRDVIAHLRTSDLSWLDPTQKRRLQETLDRVIRYIDDLDTIRERAQIIKEEVASALADKMNKNMYVLSVFTAIFLPLGFLTGLLGINVGGIPGADNPNAFAIFILMLVVLVLGQIMIFKKLKWF